jgi:hypothetical protein
MTPLAAAAIVHAEAAVRAHFRRLAAGGAPIVLRGSFEADCPLHEGCRYPRVVLVTFTQADGGGEAFVAVDRTGTQARVVSVGGGAMDEAGLIVEGAAPAQARAIVRQFDVR